VPARCEAHPSENEKSDELDDGDDADNDGGGAPRRGGRETLNMLHGSKTFVPG
jgi:hypothetical protein